MMPSIISSYSTVNSKTDEEIPEKQTVALVRQLGGDVEFDTHYPVPKPARNEVLAKVLYTGVCQSGKERVLVCCRWKSDLHAERLEQ